MNTGRVFNPCEIGDHLSDEQIVRFATLLAELVEYVSLPCWRSWWSLAMGR
jgi:hypothetical protein